MQFSNMNPEALLRIPGDIWVFWKDLHGVYLGCNEHMAKELTFTSHKEIVGKTDYDLNVLKSEADYYLSCDNSILKSGIARKFYDTATLRNEKRLCLVIKIPLVQAQNKIIGILGISFGIGKTPLVNKKKMPEKLISFNHLIDKTLITKRERECLYYLTRGKYAREIADILNISRRTVEQHIASLKIKMHVNSKSELIEKVIDNYI